MTLAQCPDCGATFRTGAATCPGCGTEWPEGTETDEDREFDARTILAQRGITLELGREFTLEQIEALAEVVKTWEA